MHLMIIAAGAALIALLAQILPGTLSPVAAADFDQYLRQAARELAKGATASRMHRVAVEPFADLDGRITPAGRFLASELATELAAGSAFQVVDPSRLAPHLQKHNASRLSDLPVSTRAKLSKTLALDGFVEGTVVESANFLRVTAKLIVVRTDRPAAVAKITLPKAGLLAELAPPPAESGKLTQQPKPASTPDAVSKPAQQPEPTSPPDAASQPPIDMVLIPAGPFIYGEDDQQQTLTLPAYWMDLFEVTYARYAEFRAFDFDRLQTHHPMTNISWQQARGYCLAQGKRLPTEQEWEKAARGTDGRVYPWGNTYELVVLNAANRFNETTAVGQFKEGRSPYGLYDMAGNASEWTESGNNGAKVFRGGSWGSPPQDVRTASKNTLAPAQRVADLGFRCAKDGPR